MTRGVLPTQPTVSSKVRRPDRVCRQLASFSSRDSTTQHTSRRSMFSATCENTSRSRAAKPEPFFSAKITVQGCRHCSPMLLKSPLGRVQGRSPTAYPIRPILRSSNKARYAVTNGAGNAKVSHTERTRASGWSMALSSQAAAISARSTSFHRPPMAEANESMLAVKTASFNFAQSTWRSNHHPPYTARQPE